MSIFPVFHHIEPGCLLTDLNYFGPLVALFQLSESLNIKPIQNNSVLVVWQLAIEYQILNLKEILLSQT